MPATTDMTAIATTVAAGRSWDGVTTATTTTTTMEATIATIIITTTTMTVGAARVVATTGVDRAVALVPAAVQGLAEAAA